MGRVERGTRCYPECRISLDASRSKILNNKQLSQQTVIYYFLKLQINFPKKVKFFPRKYAVRRVLYIKTDFLISRILDISNFFLCHLEVRDIESQLYLLVKISKVNHLAAASVGSAWLSCHWILLVLISLILLFMLIIILHSLSNQFQ